MRTLYAACLARLGLSQSGAATLHGVRLDTIKSWSCGRNPVPPGIWDDLRRYEAEIVDRSETLRELFEASGADAVDVRTDESDHAAMMAAADFILGQEVGVAVSTGITAATQMARQARMLRGCGGHYAAAAPTFAPAERTFPRRSYGR